MSNKPSGDIIAKNPKTAILTTLTAILETTVHGISNDTIRQIAIPVTPFIALCIVILGRTIYKRYKCKQLIKMFNNWIVDLEKEVKDPTTTKIRRGQAAREIIQYKNELKTVEKDFIGLAFE